MTNAEMELLEAYYKLVEILEEEIITNGRSWKVFDMDYQEFRQNKKEIRSIELWLK